MMARPRIDVLVPTFNVAATVEGSLRSILDQSVRDIRLIVVDDGSTDATRAILARLQADDPRLEIVDVPHGGIVDALNTGLAHCTAPLVARHDADDIAFADRFAVQLAYLDRHADCIAVGANAWHIDGEGRRVGYSVFGGDVMPDARLLPSQEPYLMHPFLMVRREALAAVGGYRHAFHSEDTDLYWRLLSHGRLHNLPDLLGEYRVHQGSISGASALNGRISAINSQLAAISHRRRAAGRPDVAFPRERLHKFTSADNLDAVVALAAAPLDAEERTYLRAATGLKLFGLADFRGYALTAADYRTGVRWIEAAWPHLDRAQRDHAHWLWGLSLGHLLRRRKWRAAAVLAGRPARAARLLALVARMSARRGAARLRGRAA